MKTRVVIRYGNRKMYDKEDSRYINSADLVNLLLAKENLLVVDFNSKKDVTMATILFALSKNLNLLNLDQRNDLIVCLASLSDKQAVCPVITKAISMEKPKTSRTIFSGGN